MGREVRRVSKNWEHPKKDNGEYYPLFEGYAEAKKDFEFMNAKEGYRKRVY